jgi:hypothetical protein
MLQQSGKCSARNRYTTRRWLRILLPRRGSFPPHRLEPRRLSPSSCAEVTASPTADLRRPACRLERLRERARRCVALTWTGALEPPCRCPTPRQSAGAAPHVARPRAAGGPEPPCMPPSPAPNSSPLHPSCLTRCCSFVPAFARRPRVSRRTRERESHTNRTRKRGKKKGERKK